LTRSNNSSLSTAHKASNRGFGTGAKGADGGTDDAGGSGIKFGETTINVIDDDKNQDVNAYWTPMLPIL